MKTATYRRHGGETFTVEYDENAPCICCGFPVIEASVGGTAVCPWCDMGRPRPEHGPTALAAYERQQRLMREEQDRYAQRQQKRTEE